MGKCKIILKTPKLDITFFPVVQVRKRTCALYNNIKYFKQINYSNIDQYQRSTLSKYEYINILN